MKVPKLAAMLTDSSSRTARICNFCLVASLFCLAFLIGSLTLIHSHKQKVSSGWLAMASLWKSDLSSCKTLTESLPQGIIQRTSNFEMSTMGDPSCYAKEKDHSQEASKNLLAMAVGIKQKKIVNQIVEKFFSSNFTVMLFHYDGIVDEWRNLQWCDKALHLSATNQTKWWFAKRFLHPDIVGDYDYVFLWDEDLGVEHFHPERYISIIQKEGLQISQPALDPVKSEIHHQITARGRKGNVHRRTYKSKGHAGCYENSTAPPCTGWVEMMAPVFSRTAWRCVWYMIQNDLVHAWGLDMKLGYCVKGDRRQTIGVVDSEYIVHMGIPTLGGPDEGKTSSEAADNALDIESSFSETMATHKSSSPNDRNENRFAVRRRSYAELLMFQHRWRQAVEEDVCWTDPYPEPAVKSELTISHPLHMRSIYIGN